MQRIKANISFLIWMICFCSGSFPLEMYAQEQLTIAEIQGKGNSSAYDEANVSSLNNIVTAVGNGLFFIQATAENSDQDPLSSDGLLVRAFNNNLPKVGDIVNVSGILNEDDGNTTLSLNSIEIVSNSSFVPEVRPLSNEFPSGQIKTVNDLESVENSLVSFENIWVASPSDSEGRFIISAKSERPAREAGVEYPAPFGFLEWDGNNERITMIPHALGGPRALNIFSGSKISGTGIIVQSGFFYQLWPLDYTVEEKSFGSLNEKAETELSIANMNVLRFFNYEFNYDKRLKKMARHIVDVWKGPDIIAFQEMGGRNEMIDIQEAVLALDPALDYKVWIFESGADIHNAYLTRKTISKIEVQELGVFETLTIGGRKHDRPPLLLNAEINSTDRQNISILNLHIRSLNGIEGNNSNFVRTKRHEQAVSITEMVRDLQMQNRNIIVLGDFNAFPFSDGYVDVVNQISGMPSLGAQFEVDDSILETPLINISESFTTPEESYSYVFQGNIQMLDHCLAGTFENMEVTDFQFTRGNADSPELNLVNDSNGFRISDHDGFIVYLEVGSSLEELEIVAESELQIAYPNPFTTADFVQFNLEEKDNLKIGLYSVAGVLVEEAQLVAFDQGTFELQSVGRIPAGIYFLKVEGRSFSHLGKVFVVR